MAIIIKAGDDPLVWHLGVEHDCPRCGCVYQLEVADTVRFESDPRGCRAVVSRCPTCRGEVWTWRS